MRVIAVQRYFGSITSMTCSFHTSRALNHYVILFTAVVMWNWQDNLNSQKIKQNKTKQKIWT